MKETTICLDKKKGGLGLKNFSTFNKALLCKWSWWFTYESEAFWNQVVRGKHGKEQGGWCTRDVKVGYEVAIWLVNFPLTWATRERFFFWKDKWCGSTSLSVGYSHHTCCDSCNNGD